MRLFRDLRAEEQANIVCDRLALALNDPPAFRKLIEDGLNFRVDRYVDNRLKLFDGLSLFSMAMFEALVCGGSSYSTGPIRYLWDCLERSGVVVATTGAMEDALVTHTLVKARLRQFVNTATLPNIFRPPSHLMNYYGGALIAVDVVKRGDPFRGSGFLIHTPRGPGVLTCRHNVDPAAGITEVKLTDANGVVLGSGSPALSETLDAAILLLEEPLGDRVPIWLTTDVETFDEVFTLGFPMVPGAHPALVGHRGEVNGRADIYLDKSPALLISNIVSPGSSGCPVLTSYGLCVGMTTRWLESPPEQGGARFSAALPADALAGFVRGLAESVA